MFKIILFTLTIFFAQPQSIENDNKGEYCLEQCQNQTCELNCNTISSNRYFYNGFCYTNCKDFKSNQLCKSECTESKLIDNIDFCWSCMEIRTKACLKYCNTVKDVSHNENFCIEFCGRKLSDKICEETCVRNFNEGLCNGCTILQTEELCNRFCNTMEKYVQHELCTANSVCKKLTNALCKENCNTNSSFYDNYKFCSTKCSSFPTDICTENCSNPLKFIQNNAICNTGCYKYRKSLCEDHCSTVTHFMENRFFCINTCSKENTKLCNNYCDTDNKDDFMSNYKYCSTQCLYFPNEVCNELCNTSDKIRVNENSCKGGCASNIEFYCDQQCFNVKPSEKDSEFCDICYSLKATIDCDPDVRVIGPLALRSLLGAG